MAELITDCPRCKANRITFDVLCDIKTVYKHDWQQWYEAFSVCRHCDRSTVFVLHDVGAHQAAVLRNSGKQISAIHGSLNAYVVVAGHISLKDAGGAEPPEHLPDEIRDAFVEGATCHAVNCFNAAGTMFRLCVDLATRSLLPEGEDNGLNRRVRRDLGLRLPWLFEQGLLPVGLKDLSACIKEDGNDGAHAGNLGEPDVEDLLDFTAALLVRMYTEPKRLELAKKRRDERRAPLSDATGT